VIEIKDVSVAITVLGCAIASISLSTFSFVSASSGTASITRSADRKLSQPEFLAECYSAPWTRRLLSGRGIRVILSGAVGVGLGLVRPG
jgi:hypothetical protein